MSSFSYWLNTPHFLLNTPIHHTHTTPQYGLYDKYRATIPPYEHYRTIIYSCHTNIKWFTERTSLSTHGRLKLFAFLNDLTDDHNALVTTCQIHLGCYLYLSELVHPGFSREWYKNEWNGGSRFTERNRIHPSLRKLPFRKEKVYYCDPEGWSY